MHDTTNPKKSIRERIIRKKTAPKLLSEEARNKKPQKTFVGGMYVFHEHLSKSK